MTLAAESALEKLTAEPASGVYFLHGSSVRERDEGARLLADALLDPATRDFNLDRFRGGDATPEELASAFAMPPMMAERRVVLVQDAHRLTPTARKSVLAVLEATPPDLAVIITATIPERSSARFYKDLAAAATVLEWNPPRAGELPGYAIERAKRRFGFTLEPPAAQALATALEADPARLDAELEKLGAIASGGVVDLETVRETVPQLASIDRWAWLDLVAERRYARALDQLEDLLTAERGVPLVGALIEHHLYLGIAAGSGRAAVARALKENGRGYLSWKAGAYARQAGKWTTEEIEGAIERLAVADSHLKSGGTDRGVLTDLLLGLAVDASEVS